jgi:hypothetical protein
MDFPHDLTVSADLHRVADQVGFTSLLQLLDDAYGVHSRAETIRQHHAVFVIEAVVVTDCEAVARHLRRPCTLFIASPGVLFHVPEHGFDVAPTLRPSRDGSGKVVALVRAGWRHDDLLSTSANSTIAAESAANTPVPKTCCAVIATPHRAADIRASTTSSICLVSIANLDRSCVLHVKR